ncbi:DUF542 domain-containing protein [Kyrpidia tusciae]|uniref:Hemerythrin-like domain-containing protein n=1 Tax=Kyrpidia tusciae (strain DSM 2912 / NBRC 15312 / T2) TaxID=562970 RepID=D5WPU9_KYRT2|nr:DUF542 domain-containing protein [Kyrpidia tusciae]ADG06358.1 protein of unknown function DUF542 ScdA domain protein [Kyrpidia tusciae DSM 2912]
MHTFTGSDQVGDVVARFPKAAEVFKRHRIDFCCGGGRTIHDAAQASGLNEDRILQELSDLYAENANLNEQNVNWANESMGALVDHIVNVHHAYLNTTLPVLGELTTKILRVHGANHGELASVHRLFHSLKMEFEQHLIKEETVVFPKIVEFENQKSDASLEVKNIYTLTLFHANI